VKIHVIGECCTDIYVYGRCPRLSPEVPVPVFIEEKRVSAGGMAFNVVANLQALGAQCVLHTQPEAITKTRYVEDSRNHALLRLDDDPDLTPYNFEDGYGDGDAVVISDYNKGFLPAVIIDRIAAGCDGLKIPVFLDTKKPLDWWCRYATFVKVNMQEFEASKQFIYRTPWMTQKLVITMGKNGCWHANNHYPVEPVDVMDVAGAGDTFLAGFVMGYLRTHNVSEACRSANDCARSVVGRRGTAILIPPDYANTTQSQ
jgi:bifunctional ADP-heptose synthase (sugar kinase/adenylyltransferase)